MTTLVVDASAIVELLRRTSAGKSSASALQGVTAVAPAHVDAEVFSALARLARGDPTEAPMVRPRLRELHRSPIVRYTCAPLLETAWTLRDNVSARDALYVALARRLRAPLLTADAKLARAPASALGITVQLAC